MGEDDMSTVAIIGAGLMGSATAWPLSDNNHAVRLVGTHLDADIIKSCKEKRFHPRLKRSLPRGVEPFYIEELAQALEDVEIIVSGVNSLGVRWLGRTLGSHLQPGQLIISVAKGLEVQDDGQLVVLPDVVASELPPSIREQVTLAAIGGPCIAGELAGRRHSCVVFGSRDGEAVDRLAIAFRTSYYHVWTTTDLVGLEVCAALKNAFTLGVGIVAGLLERSGGIDVADAYMHNMAAAVFAEGCTEIRQALRILGGTRDFAHALPGAGDLYVTSMGGRTVRFGRLLGLGHSYVEARKLMAGETLESVEIVRAMGKALPKLESQKMISSEDFPLLRLLVDVVVHAQPLRLPLDAFFSETTKEYA
jgi:glycerol-3-phosphate dehydrogenase (NAD(P)+)